jgi:NO-binding membrane sensor protein with MHYT domain
VTFILASQAVTAPSSTYGPTLVGMSYAISVFGSLTGLQSARRARTRTGPDVLGWLVAAAISIGGGAVWSMRFIGMLADLTYKPAIVLLSVGIAMVAAPS